MQNRVRVCDRGSTKFQASNIQIAEIRDGRSRCLELECWYLELPRRTPRRSGFRLARGGKGTLGCLLLWDHGSGGIFFSRRQQLSGFLEDATSTNLGNCPR